MRPLRTAEEVEATITADVSLPRGGRLLISEPGDGTRVTLLLLDLTYLPSGAAREVGIVPDSYLVLWGNPTKNPVRRPSTFISKKMTQVRLRTVRQELGCSLDDALPIAELIGYALDMPVQGGMRA
jgi:hypothetical protein